MVNGRKSLCVYEVESDFMSDVASEHRIVVPWLFLVMGKDESLMKSC